MKKYICDVCGWEYDEEAGYPEGGIAPGTKWEDLPEDFQCPLCQTVIFTETSCFLPSAEKADILR